MRIQECKIETFSLPFPSQRKGILLHLSSSEGRKTTTEASPYPGLNRETFPEAFEQMESVKSFLLSKEWTKEEIKSLSSFELHPSVYFALETALWDLLTLENFRFPSCKKYALLMGSPDEIVYKAKEIGEEGATHAKIKLGQFTPEKGHQIIKNLKDRFILRLDLNQKWDFATTKAFCEFYPFGYFEYIEEPCKDPKDLAQFSYPYALDETLLNKNFLSTFSATQYLKALILKPTVLYPLSPYLRLGPEIVITSTFESLIGIQQIERLICRLGLMNTKHGLDTLRYYENTSMSYCPSK